jgi:SAM-dependent methyltransferase
MRPGGTATSEAGFDAALAHLADALHARPTGSTVMKLATRRRAQLVGSAIHWLVDAEGRRVALPIHRWHGAPEPAAQSVIDRCTGPTVDVGCGPGRLTAALTYRGVISLGIDTSAMAVRLTRRRGGAALRRDVFEPLPGEGRWTHVLLMDGNIGIGGDPVALLRRCAELLRPGGTVLVELDPPGAGLWCGHARVVRAAESVDRAPGDDITYCGPSFRWARLGVEAIHRTAADAHLTVRAVFHRDRRWFAELER